MALEILQQPLGTSTDSIYFRVPVGQQLIFGVADTTIVATAFNVKYIAEVHISTTGQILINDDTRIGTFKTTPNNAGSGIFDLRPVLESYVKPDNDASEGATSYKLNKDIDPPIHLVDRFSLSENSIRMFGVKFYAEYSISATSEILQTDPVLSQVWMIFNGVLQYDNALTLINGNYGYDLSKFAISSSGNKMYFLSNAPTTQYARITDYGTLPFLNWTNNQTGIPENIKKVTYRLYDSGGSVLLSNSQTNAITTGGVSSFNFEAKNFLMYIGAFPGNLRHNSGVSAVFETGNVSYYTIQLEDNAGDLSELYTVNIICPSNQGYNRNYEMIRLAWLNQWGAWDYYTFTMKSIRSITSKKTPYHQEGGTWNESNFKIKGWKGGKKNFRVNSTEKIRINTDFVSEEEGAWFEELINSSEVYIINEFDSTEVTPYNTITNKYVEPVTVTTSNYIKKTIANDKIMQYTFEIEKSKMQRTQSA